MDNIMYKFDSPRLKVSIDLKPGVYAFEDESGTGKSYLAKIFKKLRTYREPVAAFNYEDYMRDVNVSSLLKDEYKVVMLDRYDMYPDFAKAEITDFAKEHVVLVDAKYYNPALTPHWSCKIEFDIKEIRVYR